MWLPIRGENLDLNQKINLYWKIFPQGLKGPPNLGFKFPIFPFWGKKGNMRIIPCWGEASVTPGLGFPYLLGPLFIGFPFAIWSSNWGPVWRRIPLFLKGFEMKLPPGWLKRDEPWVYSEVGEMRNKCFSVFDAWVPFFPRVIPPIGRSSSRLWCLSFKGKPFFRIGGREKL